MEEPQRRRDLAANGVTRLRGLGGVSISHTPLRRTQVLAVGTGVVVILVAIAVVLLALIMAMSARGRQRRKAQRRTDDRGD
jgi:hypothetical protein